MRRLKNNFKHFLFSSFFIFVVSTTSSATPESGAFPPFTSDKELHEEDFSGGENPSFQNNHFQDCPPPKDSDNIINYRGNRIYTDNLPLKINQTKCVRKDGAFISLDIVFNQSINPRSVMHDSILINNAPLGPGIRFHFNKKGNTIKVFIPLSDNSLKIKIQKVRSFDGDMIEPVEILAEVEEL